MELTKQQMQQTKGIAILFMLLLHLFCTREWQGLFEPLIFVDETPLIYYFALFGDMCVVMYAFASGYGLMMSYQRDLADLANYRKKNYIRLGRLYVNYWIIILIFVVILGPILGMQATYPGNWSTFLLTITAISPGYNGAWWFLTTYILLVLTSPIIYKAIMKYSWSLILGGGFILYTFGFIQRIYVPIVTESSVLNFLLHQIALYSMTLFPFIIGGLFVKYQTYSKLAKKAKDIPLKNVLLLLAIVVMIIAHGIVQNLYVAIFTGIPFIVIFNLLDKPKWLAKSFNYIGGHSTNLWLTHMFFYMIYFKQLVYAPKIQF
ncbi:MAG: acyltransferase family protein [Culicoidibacterales bacterium]